MINAKVWTHWEKPSAMSYVRLIFITPRGIYLSKNYIGNLLSRVVLCPLATHPIHYAIEQDLHCVRNAGWPHVPGPPNIRRGHQEWMRVALRATNNASDVTFLKNMHPNFKVMSQRWISHTEFSTACPSGCYTEKIYKRPTNLQYLWPKISPHTQYNP